jgi:hypothetical protein
MAETTVDRLIRLVRLYRGTEDLDALRAEFECVLATPGAAPTTRGAGVLTPEDSRRLMEEGRALRDDLRRRTAGMRPDAIRAARGDETAPAGPAATPPLAGFVVAEPCAYEFTRKPAPSPPPSGGAPKTCACGDSSAQGGHNFAGGPCVNQILRAPAPALSETPGTAETCGECAYFVARGHGNGACQPNGITAGYVHATEPACSEPGPRRAPAAPSGAGDATRCACHDDGPPMDDGRCATCLLPRAPRRRGSK